MFNSIFDDISKVTEGFTGISLQNFLISISIALALGIIISVVYKFTQQNYSNGLLHTLVLLPAVIAVIILLVGNSVARAFSLSGAFAIIRFRSAPGDPKNVTYILISMAVGLACGIGYVSYAVLFAMIFCAVLVLIKFTKFGSGKQMSLKITVPETLNFQDAFIDTLSHYCKRFKLVKIRTTDLGSLYELQYLIVERDEISEKSFIDELRTKNGNLDINLNLDQPTEQVF